MPKARLLIALLLLSPISCPSAPSSPLHEAPLTGSSKTSANIHEEHNKGALARFIDNNPALKDIGSAVGGLAALIALFVGWKKLRSHVGIHMFEVLGSKAERRSRAKLYKWHQRHPGSDVPTTLLHDVCVPFDRAAQYTKQGWIPRRMIIETYGPAIYRCWEICEQTIRKKRDEEGPKSYFEDFEKLAAKVPKDLHWKPKPTPNVPQVTVSSSRVLKRIEALPPPSPRGNPRAQLRTILARTKHFNRQVRLLFRLWERRNLEVRGSSYESLSVVTETCLRMMEQIADELLSLTYYLSYLEETGQHPQEVNAREIRRLFHSNRKQRHAFGLVASALRPRYRVFSVLDLIRDNNVQLFDSRCIAPDQPSKPCLRFSPRTSVDASAKCQERDLRVTLQDFRLFYSDQMRWLDQFADRHSK